MITAVSWQRDQSPVCTHRQSCTAGDGVEVLCAISSEASCCSFQGCCLSNSVLSAFAPYNCRLSSSFFFTFTASASTASKLFLLTVAAHNAAGFCLLLCSRWITSLLKHLLSMCHVRCGDWWDAASPKLTLTSKVVSSRFSRRLQMLILMKLLARHMVKQQVTVISHES